MTAPVTGFAPATATTARSAGSPTRVMICDDSAVIRGAVARILESDPEIAVVAKVENGKLAVDRIRDSRADVVVLDIEMPVMDGLTALPLLLRADPGIRVIMASTLTTRGADIARDLIQRPRVLRSVGPCSEEIIGELPEMFFQVRRLVLGGPDPLPDDATDGFHVLTVVEGGGAVVNGHVLSYAEAMVVPAATGKYTLTRIGDERVRLVKALVP